EHPQVRDVAVIGRDDATWGQVPVAVIVGDVEGEVLNAWARARLAAFKVPKAWIRVEALPRNATGKLDRAKVRALTSGDMSL
ncbi:MAG TPA: o-succinylbenzoate--CoA ligase, partial [Archangium sp.]